jgi:hypothetical protein
MTLARSIKGSALLLVLVALLAALAWGGLRLSSSRTLQLAGTLITRVETPDSVVTLTFAEPDRPSAHRLGAEAARLPVRHAFDADARGQPVFGRRETGNVNDSRRQPRARFASSARVPRPVQPPTLQCSPMNHAM